MNSKHFKVYFLVFFSILVKSSFSQTVQRDNWNLKYSQISSTLLYSKSTNGAIDVNNKIYYYGDTTSNFSTTSSFISVYDKTTNTNSWLTYTQKTGDNGLAHGIEVKTANPNLSYLFFGTKTNFESLNYYPTIYQYNTSTGVMSEDSLTYGDKTLHGGIKHIVNFSANGSKDTLRVFATYHDTLKIFKKLVSASGYTLSADSVPLRNLKGSIVFNNKLYIYGDSAQNERIYYTEDGVNFTKLPMFNTIFAYGKSVVGMDTLNNELYCAIQDNSSAPYVFNISKVSSTSLIPITNSTDYPNRTFTGFKRIKNQLWFSFTSFDLNFNLRPSVGYIYNTSTKISIDTLGAAAGDAADRFYLSTISDSLYFGGDFNNYNTNDKGVNIYKLVMPAASFTVNNTLPICSGSTVTFSNTSVNADSVRWTLNNNLYYSITTPSTSITFTNAGTYSVGLIAFGGTLSDTSYTTININPTPTISISASSQTICAGNSTTLTATGATTYLWASTGATTNSVVVLPTVTKTYTLTGTNICGSVATNTIQITVDALPTITLTPSSATICSGQSVTINASGATSYTWSGSTVSNSVIVTPTITSIYTVAANNTGSSCPDITATATINVNTLPTLTIVPSTTNTICSGSAVSLTVSGATAYLWDNNSTTTVITVTPSLTTTYTVNGTDANGCTATATQVIPVNPFTAITGTVSVLTNTANVTTAVTSGSVTLYKYLSFFTKFDSITTVAVQPDGSYAFNSTPNDTYIIKAIPTATNMQISYATNNSTTTATSWENASVITHGCTNATTQTVLVDTLPTPTGPGTLSGKVIEWFFVPRPSSPSSPLAPGEPLIGIVVKGGKNPGGSMLVQTTTAADGTYTLTGLPINAINGESYFISVDIPGLNKPYTYTRTITLNTTTYTNLDFRVDSVKVYPIPETVGITNYELADANITVYPNPAKQQVNLTYTLTHAANVSATLYDVLGNTVNTIIMNSQHLPNTYNCTVSLAEQRAGIYFIKLQIDNKLQHIKLIKVD